MLIKRNIDKPNEKLDLLVKYIEDNNLWGAIYRTNNEKGNITIEKVYIPKFKVCEILSISERTLRNWNNKTYIHLYRLRDEYYFVPKR